MDRQIVGIQRSIQVRSSHRSTDSSVEAGGASEAEWLRAWSTEFIGDVFEFVQIV